MGGSSKVTFSDQLGQAVEQYVRAYAKKHGQFAGLTGKERADYVKHLAEFNREELRKQISQP